MKTAEQTATQIYQAFADLAGADLAKSLSLKHINLLQKNVYLRPGSYSKDFEGNQHLYADYWEEVRIILSNK